MNMLKVFCKGHKHGTQRNKQPDNRPDFQY